jgi:hypothetical protein
MDFQKLPNLFIIGAAKAGTTSLFNILGNHSQIFGSEVKETGFFNMDERFQKGVDWYQETFFRDASKYPIRMEATPAYLIWSEKTARRIRETYTQQHSVKFIAIFRDPVQRAYSHYWHHFRLGIETLSFEDAILAEKDRLVQHWDELYQTGHGKYGYFRAGCYASCLKPFLQQFDMDHFFFMLQDDLAPEKFRNSILRLLLFLGVDETEQLLLQKLNVAALPRKRWFTNFYWQLKKTLLKPIYRTSVPKKLREEIYTFLFPPFRYPQMDKDLERQLRHNYYDEIKELEHIINRDLSKWL